MLNIMRRVQIAKWRSPLSIDVAAGTPSALAIETTVGIARRADLPGRRFVPIVEPDLVLKGAHSLGTLSRQTRACWVN